MDAQLLESHYDLKVSEIKLLDEHFGTEIYLIAAGAQKYIGKAIPLYFENIENEGRVADYLARRGFRVARFLKSREGEYAVRTPAFQFTVQEYIEGETLPFNSAPPWFLEKSADFLGRATLALKDYGPLPLRFGRDFFDPDTAVRKKQEYRSELEKAKESGDPKTVPLWEEQIRHLERISQFRIDPDRLTYANSHGDFHIGQAIVQDQDITVIDWSSACRLPVCLEVMTSYVFASPSCSEGAIDAEGLTAYLRTYQKHFPLTEYDLEAMPYVLYFWHCVCNYRPDELADMAEAYRPVAALIQKMLGWLSEHTEELSRELLDSFRK